MFTVQIFNRRGEQVYFTTDVNINRTSSYLIAKSDELDLELPAQGMMQKLISLANKADENAVTGEGDPWQSFELDTATDGTDAERKIIVTYHANCKFYHHD